MTKIVTNELIYIGFNERKQDGFNKMKIDQRVEEYFATRYLIHSEGFAAARNHYIKVDAGEISEPPLPLNPYSKPRANDEAESKFDMSFYNWNRGWNEFILMKGRI